MNPCNSRSVNVNFFLKKIFRTPPFLYKCSGKKIFLINKMDQDWAQIVPLDLKNTNSNIILIRGEKRGGGYPQKDFSSCFLRVWAQITRLELRNTNSNIILIRGENRGGGFPQKDFSSCFHEFGLKLSLLTSKILIRI